MWWTRKTIKKRSSSVTKHYVTHKEEARSLVLARLVYFNRYYNLSWNRVAIRNQRRCWGSCSSKKNLNFNYKVLFLPAHLRDYIIVHELCHLAELNHGQQFWNLVAEVIPDYQLHMNELRTIDRGGHSIERLSAIQTAYLTKTKDSGRHLRSNEATLSSWCGLCARGEVCACEMGELVIGS